MKTEWISWLAGGLILSHSMLPMVARANPISINHFVPTLEQIELTPEQQAQLKTVAEKTQSQLAKLLTPKQQEEFKNALSQGDGVRSAVQSLNLPLNKRRQMGNIFQGMQSEVDLILTSEQKQQIQQNRQSLQN